MPITWLVPASLERSTYIWIASLLLIAVCALWTPVPDVAWDVDGPWRWPLHLIQISGGWLTICSAATLDVRELAGVADPVGERVPAVDGNSNRDTGPPPSTVGEFRTGGSYGWVRHPIYAGWFLSVFGVVPMTMTRLTFAVVSGLYVLIAIPPPRNIRCERDQATPIGATQRRRDGGCPRGVLTIRRHIEVELAREGAGT